MDEAARAALRGRDRQPERLCCGLPTLATRAHVRLLPGGAEGADLLGLLDVKSFSALVELQGGEKRSATYFGKKAGGEMETWP
jgi:hypothetical protein